MKIKYTEVGHREYELTFQIKEDEGVTRGVVEGTFLAALSHQVTCSAGDKLFVTRVQRGERTWAGDRVTKLTFRLQC